MGISGATKAATDIILLAGIVASKVGVLERLLEVGKDETYEELSNIFEISRCALDRPVDIGEDDYRALLQMSRWYSIRINHALAEIGTDGRAYEELDEDLAAIRKRERKWAFRAKWRRLPREFRDLSR